MSGNPQRSPMEDAGNNPKMKKKSTTKSFKQMFKKSINVARNLFPSSGEPSKGCSYLDGRRKLERAEENIYEYYNIEQSFLRLNASVDSRDPPILLEAEAQNLGLNAAPKPFDKYTSPFRTSIKDRRENIEEVQYSSDEDNELYNPSDIYCLSDYFNFSPTQMSINSSLTFQRRSKTPTKAKDVFKETAKLEELFPNAPFPREIKKLLSYRQLDVPSDLIKDFISSPVEKEEISQCDTFNFIMGMETINRMTKPSVYDYDDSFILKEGDVQMKRMVLGYMFFYAVLFKDGLFQIFENSLSETPKFSYYLQVCLFNV